MPHDEVGAGPAVMLLHAGVADRRMWADLLPAVGAAGYRAVAVDLPGYGDALPTGDAPHSGVLDTMDALDIDRAALVGNSFGGAVALRVAVVAPERVAAMALVSTPAPGVEPSAELERYGTRRNPRSRAATSRARWQRSSMPGRCLMLHPSCVTA